MITKENTPVAEDYGYGSIKRVIITEEEIAQAVKKTGQLISEEYAGKPLLIIGILKGCYVFIADYIVDTGNTLSKICKILKERNPLSLKVYTLLNKPDRRTVDFTPDYSIFTIPDLFVVGYGLDYGEQMRNLPYIAEAEL